MSNFTFKGAIMVLCAMLLFTFCKQQKNTEAITASPKNQQNNPTANENAHTEIVQGTHQSATPPPEQTINVRAIPPTNTSRKTYLNTGEWFPVMAFQASDTTIHKQYLGKKLKFKTDFTFNILENGKVVGGGEWNFDDEKMVVYLSSTNPYYNNTWKVMEKGFTMIWIGQTPENKTGMQIRWDCDKL